ncbi:MAG TPA: hypothetical protein PKA58_04475 [Polyangium sp.]|nr:hypothetical protein [Polyangium sp.]
MTTKLSPGSFLALTFIGAAYLIGCGGTQPPPNGSPGDGPAHLHHEGGGEHHEGGHAHVFPTLDEFHELFAPIWHTESDSERTSKACEKVAAIHAQVQKIEEGPVPEKAKDQAVWKAAAHSLMEDADGLKKDCDTGREAVLPRLKNIHEGYHGLVDQALGNPKK